MRAAVLVLVVLCSTVAAEELTWQQANKRSAEALRAGNKGEGADYAEKAFELYGKQAASYSAASHAQLLLNLIDAREPLDWRAALDDLDDGIEQIAERGGDKNPTLLVLWEEGIEIADRHLEGTRVERYWDRRMQLAADLHGPDAGQVNPLKLKRVMDLRRYKGANWSLAQLDRLDAALARSPNPAATVAVALSRGHILVEAERYVKAIAAYQAAIALLVDLQDQDSVVPLQNAYAQLEFACEQAKNKECAGEARRQLQATFSEVPSNLVPLMRVEPSYPPLAALRRTQGFVEIRLVLGADGLVQDATVVASQPPGVFDAEALKAVRQWKFKPRLTDGEPVKQTGLQRFNFTMAR